MAAVPHLERQRLQQVAVHQRQQKPQDHRGELGIGEPEHNVRLDVLGDSGAVLGRLK